MPWRDTWLQLAVGGAVSAIGGGQPSPWVDQQARFAETGAKMRIRVGRLLIGAALVALMPFGREAFAADLDGLESLTLSGLVDLPIVVPAADEAPAEEKTTKEAPAAEETAPAEEKSTKDAPAAEETAPAKDKTATETPATESQTSHRDASHRGASRRGASHRGGGASQEGRGATAEGGDSRGGGAAQGRVPRRRRRGMERLYQTSAERLRLQRRRGAADRQPDQ